MESKVKHVWDWICSVLGAVCGFLFGPINGLLIALLTLMAIDYISGVAAAASKKEVTSKKSFIGIARKFMMLCILCVAHILDTHVIGNVSGDIAPIMTLTEFLFIANEGISILENASKLGLPVPMKLVAMLKQLQDLGNSDSDDNSQPSGTKPQDTNYKDVK